MLSLLLIFVAHALLRFPGDDPWTAGIVSGFLLLCMSIVRRYGGWRTASAAWAWLKSEPGFFLLIVSGPMAFVGLASTAATVPPYNHLIAYAIEVFFFGYAFVAALRAFWAAGIESIASWFRR